MFVLDAEVTFAETKIKLKFLRFPTKAVFRKNAVRSEAKIFSFLATNYAIFNAEVSLAKKKVSYKYRGFQQKLFFIKNAERSEAKFFSFLAPNFAISTQKWLSQRQK